MTRHVEALADALLRFGRDRRNGVDGPVTRSDAEDLARACFCAIAEGSVFSREEIARTLYETWVAPNTGTTAKWPDTGRDLPWDQFRPRASWFAQADAILRAFGEAGR